MTKKMSVREFLAYIITPSLPLLVFWFVPLAVCLYISFTNWDYISPDYDFVALANYRDILTDDAFYAALKNTLFFGLGTVLPTLILGFLLAVFLYRNVKGKPIFQAFLFSPWVTPMVAMSIVWSWMYRPEGLINGVLANFGIDPVMWLSSSKWALPAVMIVTVWKNAGWAMIFYADALSKIPEALYEVGYLEGANLWQKMTRILLPMVSGTTFFLAIVSLIDSIQAYDQISVLTQGGPAGESRTLLYLYYQYAFEQFNVGTATALAVIIVFLTALLAVGMKLVNNRITGMEG